MGQGGKGGKRAEGGGGRGERGAREVQGGGERGIGEGGGGRVEGGGGYDGHFLKFDKVQLIYTHSHNYIGVDPKLNWKAGSALGEPYRNTLVAGRLGVFWGNLPWRPQE